MGATALSEPDTLVATDASVAPAPDAATLAREDSALRQDAGTEAAPAASEGSPSPAVGVTPGLTPPSRGFDPTTFLSDVIVALGLTDAERMEAAVQTARNPGQTLEGVLVDTGVLSEEDLAHALSERYGVDRLDLDVFPVDPRAVELLSPQVARSMEAVAVRFLAGGGLLVAMADPSDWLQASEIARITGRRVVPAVATRSSLRSFVDTWEREGAPAAHGAHHEANGDDAAKPSAFAVEHVPVVGSPHAGARHDGARSGRGLAIAAPVVPHVPELDVNGDGEVREELRRWLLERSIAEREARIELETALLERERAELERAAS